jgi:hypothetical protein
MSQKKSIGPKDFHEVLTFRKPNELITWRPKKTFTIQELYLLDRIFPEFAKDDFRENTFLVDVFNIPNAKDPLNKKKRLSKYETVRNACYALQERPILIEKKEKNNSKSFETYAFVKKAKYNEDERFVEIIISEEGMKFLHRLKNENADNYTWLRFVTLEKITNPYVYSLYQNLKAEFGRKKTHGLKNGIVEFPISIVELQKRMGISKESSPSYLLWRNFKFHVLDKAKKVLSEMTDISFEYTMMRRFGKKYTHIIFEIEELEEKESEKYIDIEENYVDQELKNYLEKHYSEEMSKSDIMFISLNLSMNSFHETYSRCAQKREEGKVKPKNFAKYLVKSCKNQIDKMSQKKHQKTTKVPHQNNEAPPKRKAEEEGQFEKEKSKAVRQTIIRAFGKPEKPEVSKQLECFEGTYEIAGSQFEVQIDQGKLMAINCRGEKKEIPKSTLVSAVCKRIK